MRVASVATATLMLGACGAPLDHFSLKPSAGQQALVREGVPSLLSAKKHAVFLRPIAPRQEAQGRPRFVIAMLNRGKTPETFNVSSITVETLRPRKAKLRVYSHVELAQEVEVQRNTLAVSAVQSGYSQTKGQTTYNPEKAQAALNANTKRTAADLSGTEKQAQAKLAELEAAIIKDHTLMPGEWHGGVVVIDPPEKTDRGAAEYSISLAFAGERHTFLVDQQTRN
jgi:hypothetical protein